MEETKAKRRTGKLKKAVPQSGKHPEEREDQLKSERKESTPPKKKPMKKKKRKKRNVRQSLYMARIVRSTFLIFVGLLIVYAYYLQTEGVLVKGILNIWHNYKGGLLSILGFAAYSVLVFYMGARKGRKK
jgi:hypothetical protein